MSTTDPTGEGGGGGGGGEGAVTTNVEQTASPSTPITGTAAPVPAGTQQQHPPPSPLSGCYLLVVLPEPHTAQHKDLILNRLAKGFLSWDKDSCHVDLEKELLALVAQAPEGEEARNGERLIQYATENLVTEVLIHPQTNTLLQCIRNLLASFTKHRHIIHAGYTFGGNGSWILQDGTFSLADFLDAFSEHEVQRVLRAYENSVTVDIHCAGVGDWTTGRLSKETCCRSCRVRVNPDDVLTAGVPAITSFTNYIGQYLVAQTLDQLMEPSDVVGNIRFSHPTLYVFPGGQGDAALFGINGFNMLVDGGFARKACFWDFTRHLDRLDAVLVTRINNSNIGGMFSVLRKKKEMHVYPQIGHFFCNLVERRQSNSPDGDKDIDPLILNLTDIGQEMVLNLRHINLRAHPCYRDPEPINLYHKVGHGTLDMYVLSPSKDSREVREFLTKWHTSDSKLFAGSHKKDNNITFPIQNLVSICALLVWQPANPEDTITRILFPGSTPQHKIFEGFERLKHLDFLKHPVCSAKTLSPSTSLATLKDKPTKQKFGLIEKEPKRILESRKDKREPSEPKSIKAVDETVSKTTPQSTPIIPTSKPKAEVKTKKVAENKKIETEVKESKKIEPETKETKKIEPDAKESKKIEKELKEVKKEQRKESAKEKVEKREDDIKKTDLIKSESEKTASKESKEFKPKPEPKKKETKESKAITKTMKGEATPKPKLNEKKAKLSSVEKKDAVKSSPTTPKKTLNGTATKTEISKVVPKVKSAAKIAPSLPAKSAKEANNRKVVEQKNIEKSTVKDTATSVVKMPAKPKPMDRKPISRRTKPVSPSKTRMPGSPAKSTRSTPTTSVKSDKDGVIRKVKGDKGTTDSSTVSTPSGIEPEAMKPIDKSLIEQSEDISLDSIESKVLADLKEEREVVEEIEAVLQKAERIEETRKDDRFEGDDEITAEAIDKKEEDITEEDITAEIEDAPKKESSRKESQELTEEDEYLIVEKEEVYTEDSVQSGEGEQKHILDEAESEKAKILKDTEVMKEKGEKEEPEEKEKDESPEKQIEKTTEKVEKEISDLPLKHKEQLQEEVKEIIASAAEIVQKAEEKDDSGKKDSEDITKEPSSLSPDKLDSSEKKTTDTDMKPDIDQKEHILEKMEESQERISTIESGATTTAPTLPEDERIPLDEIKEDIDEKHVIEEVKEKDTPAKLKEEIPETVPTTVKPEVKVFDVRQAMQSLQRDIVKTPDEVADLPVHEEVDPKLYRMEDFEKGKEEKPSPAPQEVKEPPTPPVKEQKGVFSFFGKVADKFEKGIDKLTKKSKKDAEKDSDERSSSKSSSPKEAKVQEKTVLEEVDMEKMFPKVSKPIDKPVTFEEIKPTIVDVKTAAIKETMAFIQEEIQDAKKQSIPDIEEKLLTDKLEEMKKEDDIETMLRAKDISPAFVSIEKPLEDQEIVKEIELLKEEDTGEEAEEVKALLEEASKKFKTVKDSLRDSLESLEEKIKEEETAEIQHEIPSTLKDVVKDTLEGVVEKLEEIKPHIESFSPDIKEPEKVKFDIPKDEEFEEEYEEEPVGPFKDVKEAVRDVGEVLAGTAGIEIDDKPKNVVEIVKKVAEVLKEDDFLSDKILFDESTEQKEISPTSTERKPSKERISPISVPTEKKSPETVIKLEEKEAKITHEDIVMPRKVGITEEIPVHEEVEELIQEPGKPIALYEKPHITEIKEEPYMKVIKEQQDVMVSPVKDAAKDKEDAHKICEEMLKDDEHICVHKKPADDDTSRMDVMQAGIEHVCVKKLAKRTSFEKSEDDIEQPVISFEQKISPAKAEIVMVTPDSAPTSPKFSTDKMYDQKLEVDFQKVVEFPILPEDVKEILNKEIPVKEILEELIITKKKKITIEVIEYITVVKRIPRERVIYIIEEIIVKKGLSKESVVDDPEILKLKESITSEKRMEVEDYIVNEYIVKGKRITIQVVEEISIKKIVPKKIVIEIIEEIIVKRKIARHIVLDVSEEVLSEIVKEESPEGSSEESVEEKITPKIDITKKTPEDEQQMEVPEEILSEKRKSITKILTAEIAEMEEPITSQKRAEVEEYIVNEYVTKGDSITIQKLEEICGKKKIPKRIIIEIIEEIIIKRKIPKHVVLTVTEEELSRIIKEEVIPESDELTEERKLVVETSGLSEEKKLLTEMKTDKKEDVPEHQIEEKLLAASEDEDDEEKLVDGFVSIPRRISDGKVDLKKKAVSPVKAEIAKEHEKDVIDDFEAVEQEYKVHDLPVTSPEKADEMTEKEDIEEEAMEDTTSEVIEADEKFVQETKEKIGKKESQIDVAKDIKSTDEKRELGEHETTEVSEITDTIEKYLDEAKEKMDDIVPKDTVVKPVSSVCDTAEKSFIEADVSETISKPIVLSPKTIDESKTITKDIKSKPIKDELKDIEHPSKDVLAETPESVKPEAKLADATGFEKEPKIELFEDERMKLFETTEIRDISMVKDEKDSHETSDESLRKMSISKEPEEETSKRKTELHIDAAKSPEKDKEDIEKSPTVEPLKIDDDIVTVKRMLVTASSEDGKEETEICPTGTITFTKTITPDDSLKDTSIKSTPDKDSLFMDKDSLHSGVSSPEKDSISEKFAPDDKDKIISEDSLEKSPIGTRDSQDLDDSLEKSESRKPKDIEVPSDVSKEKIHEIAVEKDKLKSPKEKQERKFSIGDAGEIEKSKSPVEEISDKFEKPKSSPELSEEQSEKSKSPTEGIKDQIEKLKSTELTTEKMERPKSPVEEIMKKIEESKITEEADKSKSFKQDTTQIPDVSVDEKISLELDYGDTQKPISSIGTIVEKSPLESTEKPKLPIEKIFPESEKEGMSSISKTPESLRSEDISPAETIFSKSPTDKHETYFSKVVINEEDSIPEKVEKLPIVIKEAKPVTDKDLSTPSEQKKTPIPESKDNQISEKLETQEFIPKSTSSIVVTNGLSEKSLDDIPLEKSRSPSIGSEKHEEKDASSTDSEKSEDKESSVRSKSPDTKGDRPEQVEEKLIEKPQSPSIIEKKIDIVDKIDDVKLKSSAESDEIGKRSKLEDEFIAEVELKPEKEEPTDKPKSSSVISEEFEKDIKSFDKSPSALSDKTEEKEIDKLISPSAIEKETISEKSPILESGHYDEKGPIDEARSPSAISDKSDDKKEADRSKSPSITADKLDLQDEMECYLEKPKSPIFDRPESPKVIDKTEEPQDKDRSPSVASDKSDNKKISDRSRSPSIYIEKIDLKDMDLPIEKVRSPSVTSIKDDKLELMSKSFIDKAEVPRDELEVSKLDDEEVLKDIEQPQLDKSLSPSVTSTISESKELILEEKSPVTADKTEEAFDKSRLSSLVERKLDIGDEKPLEKSSLSSIVGEQHLPEKVRKSPSPAEEKPEDLSVPVMEEQKEPTDLSKSSGIIEEKPDLKDAAEISFDKSRSSSVASITGVQKEPADRSKSPSIAGDKPDTKNIIEVPTEKSRSSSVASVTTEQREPIDLSKSPSITTEKSDAKDIDTRLELSSDKSRSPSVISVTEEQKEPFDRSKSPSIAGEKLNLEDLTEQRDEKSRSPSVMSTTSDLKESEDRTKSPSITEEKSDQKDFVESTEKKSRSASVASITGEQKEITDRSKSPSISDEKSDLKDVVRQQIETSSITGDQGKLIDEQRSSVVDTNLETMDKSKSSSIASEKSDDKRLVDELKGSIASDKSDLKEQLMDKLKSHSAVDEKDLLEKFIGFIGSLATSDKKEEPDRSKSPSMASDKSEGMKSATGSKQSSIAGDAADMKDVLDAVVDKSRSSSVVSATTDQKEPIEKSVSPTISHEAELHDRDKSPSIASEKSGGNKSADDSRATSVTEEKPDLKDVMELPADTSRSPSATSLTSEKTEPIKKSISPTTSDKLESTVDRNKSPTIASDKSDEKTLDDKVISKDHYEDAIDKSPSLVDAKMLDKKNVEEKPLIVPEKLDIKSTSDAFEVHDKQQSPSIIPDKSIDDKQEIDRADLVDKTRSLSIISDKTEPKSLSDVSKSPSIADEKFDQKDKSRSSSVASEKPDDIVTEILQLETKEERSISPSSEIGKVSKDESAKSSRASSPMDKTPKDKSRSQNVFDNGEKTPVSRSRTTSLYEDKLSEKVSPQEQKDSSKKTEMGKSLDTKDEYKSSPKDKSPITSPEAIQEELKKIREKRFADSDEPVTMQPKKMEKSDDEEENIIQVTTEKKAEIEKYILEEFIFKKRKISLVVIEKLVMTYSLPQFIVIEIIEDIIDRQKVPRSSVFDFIDEELITSQYKRSELEIAPHKRAEIEKYIIEEFIAKKKKITPEALEEIIILKSVPRFSIITIIEEIIMTRRIPRNTLIEGDLGEPRDRSPEIDEKKGKPAISTSVDLEKMIVTQEYPQSREKSSDIMRSESPDGKVSPIGSDRYDRDTKALSASPSLSPEPIPSDKSTQDSPARSEPHIDEEISISDEKRTETIKLLEEEYIKKGKKITETVLEEIIVRTSLPRYIILEIIEEIILKKKIPRESIIDVEIYQEEEPEEDYDKAVYGFDRTADTDYELPDNVRKSSIEYKMGTYTDTDERQLDKSVSDYPMDYESQFHKAFVGGMTEMRTTHITTLSGKSTPEYTTHDGTPESGVETIDKMSGKLSERTLTTTHITKTDIDDSKIVPSMQTVTILRESKIAEPHEDKSEATIKILKEERTLDEVSGDTSDDSIKPEMDVIKKIVEQEIIEGKEQSQIIHKEMIKETGTSDVSKMVESDGDIVKKTMKHEVLDQEKPETVASKIIEKDEPEAITKIIKREIVEHGEPEVVTKVVKREIIEQDEPEIIKKVIRREIIAPDEEISDFKEDSGEFVKTITTKTTRTIVTEELSDAELSQTDPSRIYRDPTSGTTYKVVSEESAPDITASADVKRIVTTVTTITGPDGKVTTMKDVKESSDTVDSDELLEKLIDSSNDKTDKFTTEMKTAEKIATSMTSGSSTPDVKPFYDSGKSTPDFKQEDKLESAGKERGQERTIGVDKFEHSVSPLIRDLISDDKSYSGKSSPDISLPKDIVFSGSTGKSTPEIPMSPLIRDGAAVQPHLSGRSTPDRRSDGRSSTATPEGFRSGEIIRTIITTTKTISDEGEIVTTTREVTETTNEKGETVVLAEKTDVKVDDSLPSKDAAESAISSIIGSIKSSESQHSGSPGSDDATSEKDRGPTSPPSDRSSIQSKAMTHVWGSSEERHTYSDDEPPSSPLSSTSQIGYSSQMTRRHDPISDKKEEQKQSVEFSTAAMSSSFYGELPAVPPQISAMKTFHGETGIQKSSDPIPIHSRFMVEKEFASGYGEKPDAKKYVDEADLDFDKVLMEHKEMKEANGTFSSGIASRYTNGNLRHDVEDSRDHPSSSFQDDSKDDSKGDSKKDPLEGWGTPLGLPSPKPPRKFNLKNPAQPSCSNAMTPDSLNFDVVKDWGEPLRLPSPAPVTNEISNKGAPGTPKKERKQARKVQSENIKNKKRSESPGKNEKKMKDSKNKIQPVYMDLAYVPHHGNSYYTSLEFFKRVRARYYVFSGTEPSREVYDALLEAKKTWEDKDLEVTMIPTYDTDTLGYWVADNEEALAANHIDLSPSASRCTINLQDHETSCSAYRLEF